MCEERVEAEEDGPALADRLTPLLAGMTLGLVGPGQFFGRTGMERVTVLWVEPGPVRVVWDGPVVREAVAPLQAALAAATGALRGEFDTMHATPLSLAWSLAPAPALVADREGVVLRALDDGRVEVRGRGALARPTLRRVEAHLSDDWTHREVVLVLAREDGGEEAVTLASCLEPMATLDPTYDGIDLLLDGGWAPSMAHAVAEGLELPATIAPGYR